MKSDNVSTSTAICRICHNEEQSIGYNKSTVREPLISLCFCRIVINKLSCRGTIGLYHRSCLERWLASSNRSVCEICHFTYQILRRYRTFCEFIGSSDSNLERCYLITDITCLVILTTIVIGCITFSLLLSSAQTDGFRLWNNTAGFQAISLLILSALLLMAYCIWLTVTIIFHIQTYRHWRILNQKVLVIDQKPACSSWKTINRIRRLQRERFRISAMHLLCFDWHSFLRDLFKKHASADNKDSGNSVRQISAISNNVLNMNYDDFVRHLQPEKGTIHVIGSYQHMMASTPLPNEEASSSLQMFDYDLP
ncbi:zinc finger, C3HC4 type [Onchocerca flexuosa]|uniref:Zinc finger, C3HC4 type n=1 Tax=Onchocerca flexuosa TaxID=387005 RepID=A0A238C0Z2_9BILA|nr:zinc finger, C3HC4 type [Onchocerca flexuosa]